MSIFRDYTAFYGSGTGSINPGGGAMHFGTFVGPIDGINTTFTAPEILGTTKDDFRVYLTGVMLATADYTFTAPDIITLIGIVPLPPAPPTRMEYLVLGS